MAKDFDTKDLDDLARSILKLANDTMPKESRKFIGKEGNKLKKVTLKKARELTKEKTGNYIESIKRGKIYKYQGDTLATRVYSGSPHAHLIEEGHRQVTKDGKEIGFVRGKRVFEKAEKEFTEQFFNDAEKFVDEILDKM